MLPIGTKVRVLPDADCRGEKAKPGDILTIVDYFACEDGYYTNDGSQWWDDEVEAVDSSSAHYVQFPPRRKKHV